MIKNTVFVIKFYLSDGLKLIVTTEDDGLTMEDYQSDIRVAINDDEFYILQDMITTEWIIIKAQKIDAFSVADVGPNYGNEKEGFIFK